VIDKLAWVCIEHGRILAARSRSKDVYFIPGGKREAGESDEQALIREVHEELGITLRADTLKPIGVFEAQAHGQPEGVNVRLTCYSGEYSGTPHASAEIEEIAWLTYADRGRFSLVAQILLDELRGQLSPFQLDIVSADDLLRDLPRYVALLHDSVDSGASIGFLMPLSTAPAEEYWREIAADLTNGHRLLITARDGNALMGSVQLGFVMKPNAPHRAEVQKLLVDRRYRGRGIGKLLMHVLEQEALLRNRTLLVLDTKKGDIAERLYPKLGYIRVGDIPSFVIDETGAMHATVVFYKDLTR
jgi:8-oxo-dGTP pyrophosphatase MutT (NUDIX family)